MRLAQDIELYNKSDLSLVQIEHLDKLKYNLRVCSCPSLYSSGEITGKTNYVASIRCDDKCCFVCNFARQKMVRRKYMAWFKENKTVFLLSRADGKEKFATKSQLEKHSDYKVIKETEYDLMHLTLSVPHYAVSGFRGKKFYYDEISALYHRLRNKNSYFRNNVIGGEYGIETTNPSNLHIHIHSLLLVKRKAQSRNFLHYEVLKEWNRITENSDNPRQAIEQWQYKSVKAGNKLIDDNYIKGLRPKGSTIIGLETIYTINPATGEKVRATEWNNGAMIKAVMETISYHFAPQTFDKEAGAFDIDLFAKIKPAIYKKQLYRKFGVLHGETALNIRVAGGEETGELDIMRAINMNDCVVDTETGEILEEPKKFILTSPSAVFHDPNNDYKIHISAGGKRSAQILKAHTTTTAIAELKQIIKDSCK